MGSTGARPAPTTEISRDREIAKPGGTPFEPEAYRGVAHLHAHPGRVRLRSGEPILAVGVVPAAGTLELAKILGVPRDEDGWFSELNYNASPTHTERGDIFVAGMCQGPKDIPDTVAQAAAVAAGVLRTIACGRGMDHLSTLSLSDIESRAAQIEAHTTQVR